MGFGIELVFLCFAGQDELRRRVDSQIELLELIENLVVIDGLLQVRKGRAAGYRRKPGRELAYGCCVVVCLNVFTTAGDGDGIQNLEEVEAEHSEKAVRSALFAGKLCPDVIGFLRLTEDVVNGRLRIEKVIHTADIAFIGQLELVLEVVEAVIYRRGGEHQDLSLDSSTDDLVHQAEIAVFTRIFVIIAPGKLAAVAEVVGFVNDHEVEVAPVDFVECYAVGETAVARQV